MKNIWRAAVFVSAVMLSACSSLEKVTGSQHAMNSDSELHRHGRFAVLVYDKTMDKNTDSLQGNFGWLSISDGFVLDLSSPLGQVLARVTVQSGVSRLTRANGDVLEATNPDVLLQEVIGRQFPVSGLRYWIRGQILPGVAVENVEYDAQKRLVKFTQAGWTVTAQDYDSFGPKRFRLLNNQTMERITIRIVMHE